MDRLQSMRVFAKVVEQGSFARAAAQLDLSNAVVTRHLADLESHLGTRLLNRTTRKLSLTETGMAYLERVRQILQDIDDADAIASSHEKSVRHLARLFAPRLRATATFKIIAALCAKIPRCRAGCHVVGPHCRSG